MTESSLPRTLQPGKCCGDDDDGGRSTLLHCIGAVRRYGTQVRCAIKELAMVRCVGEIRK